MKPFARYRTWLFDCDGVLLDSNGVKTDAFRTVGLRYGADVAEQLVAYHVAHGGISRFAKVDHLFTSILRRGPQPGEVDAALRAFAGAVKVGMAQVRVEPHAETLLALAADAGARCFVVSGAAQTELVAVLRDRGLARYFAGIFGSPRDKLQIVHQLLADGSMNRPAVFVGDSRIDHSTADTVGADFVFVRQWSELHDWQRELPVERIRVVTSLGDLVGAWRMQTDAKGRERAPSHR